MTTPLSVSVVVRAVPWRESHERCFTSIEASDIGKDYVVRRHPEGIDNNQHWLETYLYAASLKTELVLLLEDDVLVNRHILWNVGTWLWTKHKEFRAGWVFNPGGAVRDEWYEGPPTWHGSQGIVYRTKDLPRLIELIWEKIQQGDPRDIAISRVANTTGRLRVHAPCLVEHLNKYPSTLGNQQSRAARTTMGTFDANWKRPDRHKNGIVDEFGRMQTP